MATDHDRWKYEYERKKPRFVQEEHFLGYPEKHSNLEDKVMFTDVDGYESVIGFKNGDKVKVIITYDQGRGTEVEEFSVNDTRNYVFMTKNGKLRTLRWMER